MPRKEYDELNETSHSFTLPFAYCRLLHCILFPAIRILFFLPLVMDKNRLQNIRNRRSQYACMIPRRLR